MSVSPSALRHDAVSGRWNTGSDQDWAPDLRPIPSSRSTTDRGEKTPAFSQPLVSGAAEMKGQLPLLLSRKHQKTEIWKRLFLDEFSFSSTSLL